MINTRLSQAAKSLVARAYDYAARDRAGEICEEHLLEAALGDPDGSFLLGAVAGTKELLRQVREELGNSRSRGGLTEADEAALTGLGIDAATVLERIEEQLGAHALTPAPASRPGPWHHPGLSPAALAILAEAERHLRARRGRSLGVNEVALALVSEPGALAESLGRRGITEATVRAELGRRPASGGAR